jgi:hypothetical protein
MNANCNVVYFTVAATIYLQTTFLSMASYNGHIQTALFLLSDSHLCCNQSDTVPQHRRALIGLISLRYYHSVLEKKLIY